MTPEQFASLMQPIIDFAGGKAVDRDLAAALNQRFPASGSDVMAVEYACNSAIKAGWMCAQGSPGRRFGRVIPACPQTRDLSVDVIDLTDFAGSLHRHPHGEICLIMPVDETARVDGKGRGWCVYGPDSTHRPTVKGGRALVLSLLPGGAIEFVE
ncbi:MAG: DUF4863 family protein [Magnetospirillum sp.]|nr:DUF4863 family protein [Magnetospirillum sp.]